jgi:hypothetical protein
MMVDEHHLLRNESVNCFIDKPYFDERNYTRSKRQFSIDSTVKHVEILIAYDNSLKNFHSNIDVQSYILTLFNYVRFIKSYFISK